MEDVRIVIDTVRSPNTGLVYESRTVFTPDGCGTCGTTGKVHYSTPEDIAEWEESERTCDDYGPERRGVKTCEACNGTGRVKWAGMHVVCTMSYAP